MISIKLEIIFRNRFVSTSKGSYPSGDINDDYMVWNTFELTSEHNVNPKYDSPKHFGDDFRSPNWWIQAFLSWNIMFDGLSTFSKILLPTTFHSPFVLAFSPQFSHVGVVFLRLRNARRNALPTKNSFTSTQDENAPTIQMTDNGDERKFPSFRDHHHHY